MMVRSALIEGEADLAMLAVHAALGGEPLEERSDSWARAELARLFARSDESPYDVGCAFLLPAFRRGGLPAVRAVVAGPLPSSEEILHPSKHGKDRPTEVHLPSWPDTHGRPTFVFSDVWGEYGITLLLKSGLQIRIDGLPPGAEDRGDDRVPIGWDGDSLAVVVFADGTQAAMWRTVWDREVDAEQFVGRFGTEFEGAWAREGHVADWAWSSDTELERQLLGAMGEVPQKLPDPQDGESTSAIERE